ncbi:hypothetical protein SGPA1_31370 [Streptomyces misionensis JCM 4497]
MAECVGAGLGGLRHGAVRAGRAPRLVGGLRGAAAGDRRRHGGDRPAHPAGPALPAGP